MILIIDNRDSFVFNLVQGLQALGAEVRVLRALHTKSAEVLALAPAGVLIGPGPGPPERAGCSEDLVLAAAGRVPVLGVCLGHQAIATAYGGAIVRSDDLAHGQRRPVLHDGAGLLQGLPSPFAAVRYNSLAVDPARLPACLEITARTPTGEIMALRHRVHAVEGLQFHPEAVWSEFGQRLLSSFLKRTGSGPVVDASP